MPPRASLCNPASNIHNWISVGPTDPKQLCDCKKLRLEQKNDEVKHSAEMFVNGVKVGRQRRWLTLWRCWQKTRAVPGEAPGETI